MKTKIWIFHEKLNLNDKEIGDIDILHQKLSKRRHAWQQLFQYWNMHLSAGLLAA